MGIVDEVKRAVEHESPKLSERPGLKKLEAFYEDMRRKGLVKKPEYSLPLPDTIGFNLK